MVILQREGNMPYSKYSFKGTHIAKLVKNLPAMQETRFQFLGQEVTPGEGNNPTPVVLPGESHGQRSLAGHSS